MWTAFNLGAEDTVPPYAVTWNTTLFTNGAHTATCQRAGRCRQYRVVGWVHVTVNNSPSSPSECRRVRERPRANVRIPANFGMNMAPTAGFTGPMSLACTNLPPASTCTVMPNPVNVSETAAMRVAITISTTARTSTNLVQVAGNTGPRPFRRYSELPWLVLALAWPWRVRRGMRIAAGIGAVCLPLVLAVSCGGGAETTLTTRTPAPQLTGTPAGTHMVTITGTSGGVTHSVP